MTSPVVIEPVWNMVLAILALAGTVGSLMGVWWKVSSDNRIIKRDLLEHERQIVVLTHNKAETADLVKLTELVAKIENQVSSHHLDNVRHRTPDFEIRLEAFYTSVQEFIKENRAEHQSILDAISGKQR
jgi:hypothetical protein